MNETFEQLMDRLKKLPDTLRDAYFSVDLDEAIVGIGKRHGLHIDQIGELAAETGEVMIGRTHPREFIPHLERRLKIPFDLAAAVAKDINEEVFLPIRGEMKKLYDIKEENLPVASADQREEILRGIEHPESYKAEKGRTPPSEKKAETSPSLGLETLATKEEEDALAQKFAKPMRAPAARTTIDPYRELAA